jgi:hypothetical protein
MLRGLSHNNLVDLLKMLNDVPVLPADIVTVNNIGWISMIY